MRKQIVIASTLVAGIVGALAAPAEAHVTVDPPSAPQGSTVKLSFLVPNEESTARVTKVQILFPTPPDAPIPGVAIGQKPGWKATVVKKHLAKAIETDDGSITDVISEIDWTATTAAAGVAPDEFGEFTIDADGLPDDESEVVFRAIQTYSNGEITRWIDPVTPGGPEAEHPTPILELTKPDDAATVTTPTTNAPAGSTTIVSSSTKDNSARALGVIGIALGAVALIGATSALMRKRRAA